MIKQKSNREKDKESTRGKRRFLERLAEEQEAEKQIKEFDRQELIEQHKENETYIDK